MITSSVDGQALTETEGEEEPANNNADNSGKGQFTFGENSEKHTYILVDQHSQKTFAPHHLTTVDV